MLDVTIVIPMTAHAAKWQRAPRVDDVYEVLWPEVRDRLPLFPGEVAREVQAEIESALDSKASTLVFVTRSEMVGLRAQRMVAEGAPIRVMFRFPGSSHPDATIGPDGEVDTWPDGLFSEDYEEVKAMRRAVADRGKADDRAV